MIEFVDRLVSEVKSRGEVLVVSGAGVSTSAGVPDFQSMDASWGFDVSREEALSERFLLKNPVKFWEIYFSMFPVDALVGVVPGRVHKFVERLEGLADVRVVTQNVDRLHQLAGSSHVVEVHGNLKYFRCLDCEVKVPAFSGGVPSCVCGGLLRPDLVMFRDAVPAWARLRQSVEGFNGVALFLGTSLRVFPLAGLPELLRLTAPDSSRWLWTLGVPDDVRFDFHYMLDGELVIPDELLR